MISAADEVVLELDEESPESESLSAWDASEPVKLLSVELP